MRGRYKHDKTSDNVIAGKIEDGHGETSSDSIGSNTPEARTSRKADKQAKNSDKVYLGVRVKMPVKDMLQNIRLAQGWEPQTLKDLHSKEGKGENKRVKTRTRCQSTKKKIPTKSLEELAIIVEVLEEDLRSNHTGCHNPQAESFNAKPLEQNSTGYNSDESEEMIPSPGLYTTFSPAESQQALSPSPDVMPASCQWSGIALYQEGGSEVACGILDDMFGPQNPSWNQHHFWVQLQREETLLRDVSETDLLAVDEHGQTVLHKAVCRGKRAHANAIAKRMAASGTLNMKDSEGMTALLHAVNNNHHLIVEDLVQLGADVNECNYSGKSCLHLSAGKGYIRVLEVLKHAIMDGLFVNFEATDIAGMSVMQCASLSLKSTLHDLELSRSPNETRLLLLRKEQFMETLECLLQMDSFCHTMWGCKMQA